MSDRWLVISPIKVQRVWLYQLSYQLDGANVRQASEHLCRSGTPASYHARAAVALPTCRDQQSYQTQDPA